ncbi:hypothetical protein WKI68_10515 [Streptomyces sp. MS1.HAVA.3]|uniref:Uncharacterized protein n=1 Tax=Streptomyces caledonius TaxID=3134107 RepID=A0ABU8U1M9_9ACTN
MAFQTLFGGQLAHPPSTRTGGAGPVQEVLGGTQRRPGCVLGGQLHGVGGRAEPEQGAAVGHAEQGHIGVEGGDIPAAVVAGEQEAPGQSRRPGLAHSSPSSSRTQGSTSGRPPPSSPDSGVATMFRTRS